MKYSVSRFVLPVLVLCALAWATAASSLTPTHAAVPAGLSAADWAVIQTIIPGDYLKASNTEADDAFGRAIAIDGDTMVVGAWSERSNATVINGNQTDNSLVNAGAAYVFVRTGEVWSQQAYLKASNTGAMDRFGWDVAIDGDTIVVGAWGESSNATGVNGDEDNDSAFNSGAVYVFTRADGVWSQQAYLKASNTETVDFFGYAVAIDGDTIVAGAYGEDSNSTGVNNDETNNSMLSAGAAYVFTRTNGVWSQQAYLKASNPEANDQFGGNLAISGNTIAIGALNEDSNATGVNGDQTNNSMGGSGAVYVFTRIGETWSQEAYLKASNTGANDNFGDSIAVDGDTIAVGARYEDSNATGINNSDQGNNLAPNAGSAYVFTRTGGVWSQQAYLKASNTEEQDRFGTDLAIEGDTIVVGALAEDSNATGVNGTQANNLASDSGAAYVFVRTAGVWSQRAYLKASNTEVDDIFGASVVLDGDTLVIGAFGEDSNATGVNNNQTDNSSTDSGAVYTFLKREIVYDYSIYLPLVER